MVQGDKKTKQGIGEIRKDGAIEPAPRSPRSFLRESFGAKKTKTKSDPPISSGRGQATQRGLPRDDKKIVTKAGLAPPAEQPKSNKPTNPGLEPPPSLDEMQYELDGSTGDRKSRSFEDEDRISAREEMTPSEGTPLNGAVLRGEVESDDRSRFKTAPGGGRNRVSGGRSQAAAYVSPATLPPGHKDHITSAVKVDELVAGAVRVYETEPSLMRRRASSLPPRVPSEYERKSPLIWVALVVGLALGGGMVWLMVGRPAEKVEETGNAAAARPSPPSDASTVHAASAPQATPAEKPPAPVAAVAAPPNVTEVTQGPSRTAAPKPSSSIAPVVQSKPVAQESASPPQASPPPQPDAGPSKKQTPDEPWLE